MRISRAAVVFLVGLGLAVAAAAVAMRGDYRSGRMPAGVPVVRVAAASDLRFALEEVVARFADARPPLDLQVSYGSSGTFFAQIVNGAPFDLFMSADIDYPRQLAARGFAVPGSEFTYGVGRLVVWVPPASPLDVESSGLQVLVNPAVKRVSIANPATAPYGRAAVEAMRHAGVYDRVRDRIVMGDNVAQAMQFVTSGAADVGVVALSLAAAPAAQNTGRYATVPVDAYPRMDQGGVILRTAADLEAARAVRQFLLDDEGRATLERYGFALND